MPAPLPSISGSRAGLSYPAAPDPLGRAPAAESHSAGEPVQVRIGGTSAGRAAAARSCSCGRCSICAVSAYNAHAGTPPAESVEKPAEGEQSAEEKARQPGDGKNAAGAELSAADKLTVGQLERQDQEIRAHERAHLAAAGPYARSGAQYSYVRGPDGKLYAAHGEVSIDTGRENEPEATIAKMKMVRRAALAPVQPSPQDRRVAASASADLIAAVDELRRLLEDAAVEKRAAESQGAIATEEDRPRKFATNSAARQMINVAQHQYGGFDLTV